MREIRAEAALDNADEQHVREAAGQDAIEGVGTIGPALGERDAISALRVETQSMVEVGATTMNFTP